MYICEATDYASTVTALNGYFLAKVNAAFAYKKFQSLQQKGEVRLFRRKGLQSCEIWLLPTTYQKPCNIIVEFEWDKDDARYSATKHQSFQEYNTRVQRNKYLFPTKYM